MLGVALLAGLAIPGQEDADADIRKIACEQIERPSSEPETAVRLTARELCADGDWPAAAISLDPPYEYIHRSGFIETPMRVESVAPEGGLLGIVCPDKQVRWGARESRIGGEWEPDWRRRECVETYADDIARYGVIGGPVDNFFLVALLLRGDVYFGWTHLQSLDVTETPR